MISGDVLHLPRAHEETRESEQPEHPNPLIREQVNVSSCLSRPWPVVDYVVRDLGITSGPVSLLVGSGFSAKTLLVMRLALSVAAGIPFLDFETAQGPVLHLDLEQGGVETGLRYKRMATALGLTAEHVPDLSFVEYPRIRLDDAGAEHVLLEALAGHRLCIIDSLRAAMRASENSSDSREHVDMLGRVSNATKCAIILIHHSGKSRSGVRGSSAFFDAAATVLVANKHKDGSIQVTQTKTRTVHSEGFRFVVRDVGDHVPEIGRQAGLQLVRVSSSPPTASHEDRILRVLKEAPGNVLNAALLFARVGGRRSEFLQARNKLAEAGKVRLIRRGRENYYAIKERVPEHGSS